MNENTERVRETEEGAHFRHHRQSAVQHGPSNENDDNKNRIDMADGLARFRDLRRD